MRRFVLLAAAFGYMVLLIEALHAAVDWWRDELETIGAADYLLIAALPVLIWIWLRYFSMFRPGCKKNACALPQDREKSS